MVNLGPFLNGINNRQASHALPEGTVRNAVNADIDSLGYFRRRSGSTKVISLVNGKSGYNCPLGSYFVEGSIVKKFNGSDDPSIVYAGVKGNEFAWEYFNGILYFSDGTTSLKISSIGVTKWGMDIPCSPTLMAGAGSLSGGQYMAACTFVDSNGVESGSSDIVSINCDDDAGVMFVNIPNSSDPQVEFTRLYLSYPNGKTLFHLADVTNGTSTFVVTFGRYDDGKILENEFGSPPVPGRIIRQHKGTMFVVAGSVVRYTLAYNTDIMPMADNYLQFPSDVTVFEPSGDGIFVVADETYRITGDHGSWTQSPIMPCGAVYGTGQRLPNSNSVTWFSDRGVIIGHPDGSFENLQESNVAPGTGTNGSMQIRENSGLRQAVASIKNPTVSPLAASSFVEAEFIRRGTQ